MHHALGDAFAVEMRVLFNELPILQQKRPARAGGKAVLVIRDWNAGGRGLRSGFGHCRVSC